MPRHSSNVDGTIKVVTEATVKIVLVHSPPTPYLHEGLGSWGKLSPFTPKINLSE